MTFQTICRICVNENPEMVSIFASYNFPQRNSEIFKVITDCASVQIQRCDGFSEQICLRCLDDLSQAYRFKILCEDSDYKFRNNLIVTHKIEMKTEFIEENTIITYDSYDEAHMLNMYEIKDSGRTNEVKTGATTEQYEDEIITEYKTDIDQDEVQQEELKCRNIQKQKTPYKCELCQKEFTFKSRLLNHIKTHTGEKTYKCDLCEKTFRQRSNLTHHLRMHAGEKPYECEYCEKKFTKSSNLTEHIRMHTGEKPYKCQFCEKTFTRRTGLTKHIRVHTGEKNYKCEFCEKRFADGSSLAAHTRLHLGEKSFKCDICEKKFTQSGHLAIHVRMHTGEKPFNCELCERKFAQKSGLTKHIRIHTRDKPYKCDFCEKRFACGSNLSIHVSRMHTEKKNDVT